MYLHGTSKVNGQGHLEIGGCDVDGPGHNSSERRYILWTRRLFASEHANTWNRSAHPA